MAKLVREHPDGVVYSLRRTIRQTAKAYNIYRIRQADFRANAPWAQ